MRAFFSGIWNDEQAFQRLIAGSLFIVGGVIKRGFVHIGDLDPDALRNLGEVIQALGVVLAVGKLTTFMTKGVAGAAAGEETKVTEVKVTETKPAPPEEKKP